MHSEIVADLHNHTTASDGDYSPADLVMEARRRGLAAVAVTDHDTLFGLSEALDAGWKLGIQVIPGVEISIRFLRPDFVGTLHLLCFMTPAHLADPVFVRSFTAVLAQGRGEALVRERVLRINREFGPHGRTPLLDRELEPEEIIPQGATVSRRNFARALEKEHGVRDPAVVTQILCNASPAYLPSGGDLAGVGRFIAEKGLLAALAHPAAGSFPGKGHYKEVLPPVETVEKLLPEILAQGVRGLEVFYPGHTREQTAQMLAWAETHHLVVTGGSDCHDARYRPLGQAGLTRPYFDIFLKAVT
jgi:3',5'-nucleoside bisphosphate phosphatase